jgi:hypothetical protein
MVAMLMLLVLVLALVLVATKPWFATTVLEVGRGLSSTTC